MGMAQGIWTCVTFNKREDNPKKTQRQALDIAGTWKGSTCSLRMRFDNIAKYSRDTRRPEDKCPKFCEKTTKTKKLVQQHTIIKTHSTKCRQEKLNLNKYFYSLLKYTECDR